MKLSQFGMSTVPPSNNIKKMSILNVGYVSCMYLSYQYADQLKGFTLNKIPFLHHYYTSSGLQSWLQTNPAIPESFFFQSISMLAISACRFYYPLGFLYLCVPAVPLSFYSVCREYPQVASQVIKSKDYVYKHTDKLDQVVVPIKPKQQAKAATSWWKALVGGMAADSSSSSENDAKNDKRK